MTTPISTFSCSSCIVSLIARLLEKQKGDSFYKPYLDYVENPKNCLALSYQEIEGLGDRNLQLAIIRMKQGFEKNFSYFKTFYQEQFNSDLEYSEFLWAYQFVMTRCFGGDDHIESSTLVPFGDMLNHHDKSQLLHEIAVSENDREFLIFYTIEKYADSDESGKRRRGVQLFWKAGERIPVLLVWIRLLRKSVRQAVYFGGRARGGR